MMTTDKPTEAQRKYLRRARHIMDAYRASGFRIREPREYSRGSYRTGKACLDRGWIALRYANDGERYVITQTGRAALNAADGSDG